MDRDIGLENSLKGALAKFHPKIDIEDHAYRLTTKFNEKEVIVTWPYPLMEVFFDFIESGNTITSESVEFYEGETSKELSDYVSYVVSRYLQLPAEIQQRKGWPSVEELRVQENGAWKYIFD